MKPKIFTFWFLQKKSTDSCFTGPVNLLDLLKLYIKEIYVRRDFFLERGHQIFFALKGECKHPNVKNY